MLLLRAVTDFKTNFVVIIDYIVIKSQEFIIFTVLVWLDSESDLALLFNFSSRSVKNHLNNRNKVDVW